MAADKAEAEQATSETSRSSEAVQEPATTTSSVAPTSATSTRTNPLYGTLVFASFSLISLIVCLAKGIVLVYFSESILWCVLALVS
jgi:hypothetical protein